MRRLALLALALLALSGCGGGGDGATEAAPSGPKLAGFELRSADVEPGGAIPKELTCDGADVSPQLSWAGVPEGTATLALVLEDPDAPGGTFTHWLAWSLPADATSLPGSLARDPTVRVGAAVVSQGASQLGDVGYWGPCPPEGEEHTYVFRLLALDGDARLPDPGADRAAFDAAVRGHVLGEARLEATYARG